MSNIQAVIARIPQMGAKGRANLRRNAQTKLGTSPDDKDALAVLVAIEEFEEKTARPQSFEVTGLIAWEKSRPGQPRTTGFHDGRAVATIFKNANHTNSDKEVYTLEVEGQQIDGQFHRISEARLAGESTFAPNNPT